MIVTAWNNSEHHQTGAGYGLQVNAEDRARNFKKEWEKVLIRFPDRSDWIEANIAKKSFWANRCGELINKEIGKWFLKRGLAPWPKGHPPKFELEQMEANK